MSRVAQWVTASPSIGNLSPNGHTPEANSSARSSQARLIVSSLVGRIATSALGVGAMRMCSTSLRCHCGASARNVTHSPVGSPSTSPIRYSVSSSPTATP